MAKKNCWEHKKCGREPGGEKVKDLGVCPAATEMRTDGMNGGKNGGRVCWAIAGTLCGGIVQGTFAMKLSNCQNCDFYNIISQEEGPQAKNTITVLEVVRKTKPQTALSVFSQ